MTLSPRVRIALTLGAILLIITIVIVRGNRVPASDTIVAWSGSGAPLQDPSAYAQAAPSTADSPYASGGTALDTTLLATTLGTDTGAHSAGTYNGAFDSLLDDLLRTPQSFSTDSSNTTIADAISDALAAVPQFALQFSGGAEAQVRTPQQEAIFAYGNKVGAIIKRYEAEHADGVQILGAQAEDRTSAPKAQALRNLGAAIAKIGTDMRAIEDVPESAAVDHARLAESYETAGTLLARVADAQDDASFVSAVTTYSGSVGELSGAYTALATYFSLAGVHFSSTDGGSVFSFNGFGGI